MALNFANNNSLSAITAKPSGLSGGSMNLISTQTASSSSTISFTSGIDDTYDEYVFKFYDIHAQTQNALFQVNFRDGGTNYDAVKTTTLFGAYHYEDNSDAGLGYRASSDLAQSTAYQDLIQFNLISNGNDSSLVGKLKLFNPSSTTFVKNFLATTNSVNDGNGSDKDYSDNSFIAGYCNTTTAIDGVQFKMSTGNIDSGVIKLYGIS